MEFLNTDEVSLIVDREESAKSYALPVNQTQQGLLKASSRIHQPGNYKISLLVGAKRSIVSHAVTVEQTTNCVANFKDGSSDIYLCPNTNICTSSYFNCARLDDSKCP